MTLFAPIGTKLNEPAQGGYAPGVSVDRLTTMVDALVSLPTAQFALGRVAQMYAPDPGTFADMTTSVPGHETAFYDPLDHIQGYEQHASEFRALYTPESVAYHKSMIDQQRQRDKRLDEAGAFGMASEFIAYGADPLMYIPLGGALKGATVSARLAKATAAGLGLGAVFTAAELGSISPPSPEEAVYETASMGALFFILGSAGAYRLLQNSKRWKESKQIFLETLRVSSDPARDLYLSSVRGLSDDELLNLYNVRRQAGGALGQDATRARMESAGVGVATEGASEETGRAVQRLTPEDIFDPIEFAHGGGVWDQREKAGALVSKLGTGAVVGRLKALLGEEALPAVTEHGRRVWLVSKLTPSLDIQFNSPSIGTLRFYRGIAGTWLTDEAASSGIVHDFVSAQDRTRASEALRGQAKDALLRSWLKHRGVDAPETQLGLQKKRVKTQFKDAVQKAREGLRGVRADLNESAVGSSRTASNPHINPAKGSGASPLNWDEFQRRVGRRMRDGAPPDAIAEVNEAAEKLKNEYFDKLFEWGKTEGVFVDPAEEAVASGWRKIGEDGIEAELSRISHTRKTYLTQVWNRAEIAANQPLFRGQLATYLGQKFERAWLAAEEKLKTDGVQNMDDKALQQAIAKLRKSRPTPDEIQTIARRITDNLMGLSEGHDPGMLRLPEDVVSSSPRLRAIKLDVDVNNPMWSRFLEDDAGHIIDLYHRSMVPRLALLERFGTLNFEPFFDAISVEYAMKTDDVARSLLRRADETEEQFANRVKDRINRLAERHKKDRRILADTLKVLTNTHLQGVSDEGFFRSTRFIKDMVNMAISGGFGVSSLPDAAVLGLRFGFTNVFEDSIKLWKQNPELFRMESSMAGQLAGYYEMELMSRAGSLMEFGGAYGQKTWVERAASRGAQEVMLVNMLLPWNHMMKSVASTATQANLRIIATKVAAGTTLTERELSMLQRANLTTEMVERINAQIEQHGIKTEGGQILSNVGEWTDDIARDRWEIGVNRVVDGTILTPGIGDRWKSTRDPLLSTLLMYQSFSMAATEHVMMSVAQERDKQALNGALGLVAMGMMVSVLKDIAAGRDPNLDPGELVWQGIDRSGLLGQLVNLDHYLEVGTGNRVGVHAVIGGTPPGGAGDRALYRTFGGPAAGYVSDLSRVLTVPVAAVGDSDVTKSDVSAARRALPGHLLPLLQYPLGVVTEAIRDQVGKSN